MERATDFHREPRPERRYYNVGINPLDSQLLGLVHAEAYGAGFMCGQVLRLGSELAVRSREQQGVGDERVECTNISGELRSS